LLLFCYPYFVSNFLFYSLSLSWLLINSLYGSLSFPLPPELLANYDGFHKYSHNYVYRNERGKTMLAFLYTGAQNIMRCQLWKCVNCFRSQKRKPSVLLFEAVQIWWGAGRGGEMWFCWWWWWWWYFISRKDFTDETIIRTEY
jgi:hypothetical protein